MMFRVFNNRFTFQELENDEKNIYSFDWFVFMPSHIYKRHISPPVRKMCPIPNIPLIGENIIIFSNNTLQVLIFEKYTLLNLIDDENLNHGKNLPDWCDQNHCKNIGETFGHLLWFPWTKTVISFFYFKDYFLRKNM